MQLGTSMPELGDFAIALRDASAQQRKDLLDYVESLDDEMCLPGEVRLYRTLSALILCLCQENDLAVK